MSPLGVLCLLILTAFAASALRIFGPYNYFPSIEAQFLIHLGFNGLAIAWGWVIGLWTCKRIGKALVFARQKVRDHRRCKEALEWYVEALGGDINPRQIELINERLTYGDRWEAAEGLLKAYYGPGIETSDIKRLDDLADRGWRVTGKLTVDALCLSLAGRHQIYTPLRLLPQQSTQPLPAAPSMPSPSRSFQEDDPWYSPDVLKFFVARNTFTLFQRHSSLDLELKGNEVQRTGLIQPEAMHELIKHMESWLKRKTSEAEAAALGTDLGYVREHLKDPDEAVWSEQLLHSRGVMWEVRQDGDRRREKDPRRPDEHRDRLQDGPGDE